MSHLGLGFPGRSGGAEACVCVRVCACVCVEGAGHRLGTTSETVTERRMPQGQNAMGLTSS